MALATNDHSHHGVIRSSDKSGHPFQMSRLILIRPAGGSGAVVEACGRALATARSSEPSDLVRSSNDRRVWRPRRQRRPSICRPIFDCRVKPWLLFPCGCPRQAKSHAAVGRLLGLHFVETGQLDPGDARLFARLQKYRIEADYSAEFVLTRDALE